MIQLLISIILLIIIIKYKRYINKKQYVKQVSNKNILITGATSGLGLELARKYSEYNCNLYLIGRKDDELQKVNEELGKICKVKTLKCDLGNEEQTQQLMEQLKDIQFELIVLNAGIGFQNNSNKYSDYIKANNLNISANQFLADNLQFNQVLFISSPQSLYTMPHRAVYASAKACMNQFLNCYYCDHQNVRVIKAYPRWFASNLRQNALGSNQNRKQSKGARTAKQTADIIVNQLQQGKNHVCLKPFDKFLQYANLILGNKIFSFGISKVLKYYSQQQININFRFRNMDYQQIQQMISNDQQIKEFIDTTLQQIKNNEIQSQDVLNIITNVKWSQTLAKQGMFQLFLSLKPEQIRLADLILITKQMNEMPRFLSFNNNIKQQMSQHISKIVYNNIYCHENIDLVNLFIETKQLHNELSLMYVAETDPEIILESLYFYKLIKYANVLGYCQCIIINHFGQNNDQEKMKKQLQKQLQNNDIYQLFDELNNLHYAHFIDYFPINYEQQLEQQVSKEQLVDGIIQNLITPGTSYNFYDSVIERLSECSTDDERKQLAQATIKAIQYDKKQKYLNIINEQIKQQQNIQLSVLQIIQLAVAADLDQEFCQIFFRNYQEQYNDIKQNIAKYSQQYEQQSYSPLNDLFAYPNGEFSIDLFLNFSSNFCYYKGQQTDECRQLYKQLLIYLAYDEQVAIECFQKVIRTFQFENPDNNNVNNCLELDECFQYNEEAQQQCNQLFQFYFEKIELEDQQSFIYYERLCGLIKQIALSIYNQKLFIDELNQQYFIEQILKLFNHERFNHNNLYFILPLIQEQNMAQLQQCKDQFIQDIVQSYQIKQQLNLTKYILQNHYIQVQVLLLCNYIQYAIQPIQQFKENIYEYNKLLTKQQIKQLLGDQTNYTIDQQFQLVQQFQFYCFNNKLEQDYTQCQNFKQLIIYAYYLKDNNIQIQNQSLYLTIIQHGINNQKLSEKQIQEVIKIVEQQDKLMLNIFTTYIHLFSQSELFTQVVQYLQKPQDIAEAILNIDKNNINNINISCFQEPKLEYFENKQISQAICKIISLKKLSIETILSYINFILENQSSNSLHILSLIPNYYGKQIDEQKKLEVTYILKNCLEAPTSQQRNDIRRAMLQWDK